jgi:hypothetical protein
MVCNNVVGRGLASTMWCENCSPFGMARNSKTYLLVSRNLTLRCKQPFPAHSSHFSFELRCIQIYICFGM